MHSKVKKNRILPLAIILGLLMLIAILCINNSTVLAASFGFVQPAKIGGAKSKPLQTPKASDQLCISSIPLHTYQRSHVADQPSDALEESDTETSPSEAQSSHVTKPPIHGAVYTVPISPRIPHIEYIRSVNLNHSRLSLKKSETAQLTAVALPTGTIQSKQIAWSSSNPSVATVDKTGKVTAIEGGNAIIIAKSVNGKTASCAVTVSVPASSMVLNINDTKIEKGDSRILTAQVGPADTTDSVIWSTSNPSVASVDDTGKVVAVGTGTAIITAKAGNQAVSCTVTVGISITKIVLNEDETTLTKGNTTVLTGMISPADTTEDKTIVWASSNPAAATVDEFGKVTAVEGGKTIITAKVGRITAQCEVTVIVPVTGIFVQPSISLEKGKTAMLAVTITPDDATDKAVVWSSSNPFVASVDDTGKVFAVGAGTAVITAKTGNQTAQCEVTVGISIAKIVLNKDKVALIKGSTTVLTGAISPADTTESKTISWVSSNPAVATVDKFGKVTAVEGGRTIITAKAGKITAQCEVAVLVPVAGIFVQPSLTLEKGKTAVLAVKITPDDATNKLITWSSSNPSVASVDDTGKVTAVGVGTAVITAKTGNQTAQCDVTVGISIAKIVLNKDKVTLIKGSTTVLTGVISPIDTTEDKIITWTSSNPAAVTVDESGKITAAEGGKAIITAKAGKITAQCEVTVLVPVAGISVQPSMALEKGKTAVLAVKITPDDATDKAVVWSSSNPSVVSVDNTGKVSAVGVGTAVITAKTGNQTAQCEVTVGIFITKIVLNKDEVTLTKGSTTVLTGVISPADTTEDKTITWASSNSAVATVDESGKVTAVEGGKTIITAKAGKITAKCEVTIRVPAVGITLDQSSMTLAPNGKAVLKAVIQPTDATDKAVLWSSDHPDVIAVDQEGNIQAVATAGQATITVKTHDGGYAASCVVRIQAVPSAPQNLKAEMVSNTQVRITWAAPTSSGTSPISSYIVTANGTKLTVKAGAGNSLIITCPNCSVLALTAYAVNSEGNSASSGVSYSISKSVTGTHTMYEYSECCSHWWKDTPESPNYQHHEETGKTFYWSNYKEQTGCYNTETEMFAANNVRDSKLYYRNLIDTQEVPDGYRYTLY